MNILTWAESTQRGTASYNNIAFGISTKPALSFAFDGLYYEDLRQAYAHGGEWINLTADQVTEVESFIAQAYESTQSAVWGLNAAGMFIGRVKPTDAASQAPVPPPSNDYWLWNTTKQEYEWIHAVDANGMYLGNVPTTDPRYTANVGSPAPFSYSKWDATSQSWIDGRVLDDFKTEQLAQISAACAQQIIGGVQSSALGATFTYPTDLTSQANLSASVLDSVLHGPSNANYTTAFKCMDANGVWARRPHTAAQIQQVGTEVKAAILTAQSKKDNLEAQIAAVDTTNQTEAQAIAAVQAITW